MAVTAHPLATRTALRVLRKGGNAVDAAIAAAFVLAVVEPYSSGLGGGGFLLVYRRRQKKVEALDFRERAPLHANKTMFSRHGQEEGQRLAQVGHLAVAVPGMIAGMEAANKRYGSWKLARLIEPARRIAARGFRVFPTLARALRAKRRKLRRFPDSRRIFLRRGRPLYRGAWLRQRDLARTLHRIQQKGAREFYHGKTARLLVEEMKRGKGLITSKDLARYRVRWTRPIKGRYRGYHIYSMGPPSSGGVHLLQILNILSAYRLSRWKAFSFQRLHLFAEAMKRAFADRTRYLGDATFVRVPVQGLISRRYAAKLRRTISLRRATPAASIQPGNPFPFEPEQGTTPKSRRKGTTPKSRRKGPSPPSTPPPKRSPAKPSSPGGSPLQRSSSGKHTSHLSVIDRYGNAASMTLTINTWFGSGVVARGTGIVLNNEMDDFAISPDTPNAYKLIQGEANAIAPGKTPLSSMTPTLILRRRRLVGALGSPGGPRIISIVAQLVSNLIDHRMSIEEAIRFPRIHHQWRPPKLFVERPTPSNYSLYRLRRLGHPIKIQYAWGNAMALWVDHQRHLTGAADPRGDGLADGF